MKIVNLTFLCFSSLFSISQDVELSASKKHIIDTNYIEDFSESLVLRLFIKKKFNEVSIEDTKNNNEIVYLPNQSGALGVGFNYKWLGLDLAFKVPNSDSVNNDLGKTKSFDLQANVYMRKFTVDVFFLNYEGYYVDNSAKYGSPDEKIKYANLETGIIGANFNYLFNHKKFSYRAAYLQNERQKKSAGSFILGIFFSQNYIRNKNGVIPNNFKDDFWQSSNIEDAKYTFIGAQFGYAHSFVLKKFYLTTSLGLGFGSLSKRIKTLDNPSTKTNQSVNSKVQFRGAIGYNGDRFNIGLQGTNDTFIFSEEEETQVSYQVGSIKFFIAYRLKAPKFLEKVGNIKLF